MADDEQQLLERRRELLLKRRAALEAQTAKNLQFGKMLTEDLPNAAGKVALKGLTAVQDVFNIAGQKAADLLSGGDAARPVSKADLIEPAQPWSKYLEKRGVPEGALASDYVPGYAEPGPDVPWYRPEKGGMLDPSIRGTMGTALDLAGPVAAASALRKIGFDPAKQALEKISSNAMERGTMNRTWGDKAGTVGTLAKSALTNPLTSGMRYAGARQYSKGIRPIDEMSVRFGKPMLSPDLMKKNVMGSADNFAEFIDDEAERLGDKAMTMAKKVSADNPVNRGSSLMLPDSGGVDLNKAMGKTNAWLRTLKIKDGTEVDPTMADIFNAIQNKTDEIAGAGRVSAEDAVRMKKNLYSQMPGSAYDNATKTASGTYAKGLKARGLKEEIEQLPNGGRELGETFEEWGRYLTPRDAAQKMANKAAKNPLIREGDFGAAGMGGAIAGAAGASYAAVPKMGYRLIRATPVRTTGGWMVNKATDLPYVGGLPADLVDMLTRQKASEIIRGEEGTQ